MTLSSPVRVVIVDDQPYIRTDTEVLVHRQPNFIVVGSCGSVKEALIIIPATKPDLLLLDISLGDGIGFDILQQLSPAPFKVIFLTAHQEHAIRVIKYGALDYLLKPLSEAELQEALSKVKPMQAEQLTVATQQLNTSIVRRLVLRTQQYLQVVELDDIMYCQGEAGYTTFYLADDRKVLTSKYLKEYEDVLPGNMFLRPHQSYMVNSRYIDKFRKEDDSLILRNGTAIPVATRRKESIQQYFNQLH